ncbi:MAG: hypothetical protein VYB08_00925, partial [Candidatus Latescibacterota bacterium]|nr:hypothetical protein [Candidatus Latescibacterota bacterium]
MGKIKDAIEIFDAVVVGATHQVALDKVEHEMGRFYSCLPIKKIGRLLHGGEDGVPWRVSGLSG